MLPVHQFQNLPRKETSKNERGVTDPNARFCDSAGPDFGGPLLAFPKISSLLWNNSNSNCACSRRIKFCCLRNPCAAKWLRIIVCISVATCPKFVHNDHIQRKRSFVSSIDTAMTLSSESIIGLVTLVIACPPTAWSLYMLYRHLRRSRTECKYRLR
jgi:hypothetical protein